MRGPLEPIGLPTQILWAAGNLIGVIVEGTDRARTRDTALRRTRVAIAGIAAGAVALSGVFAAVAAQAFKGHPRATATAGHARGAAATQVPSATQDPAPLQAPAAPPAASEQQPSAAAPEPQVSGGS